MRWLPFPTPRITIPVAGDRSGTTAAGSKRRKHGKRFQARQKMRSCLSAQTPAPQTATVTSAQEQDRHGHVDRRADPGVTGIIEDTVNSVTL